MPIITLQPQSQLQRQAAFPVARQQRQCRLKKTIFRLQIRDKLLLEYCNIETAVSPCSPSSSDSSSRMKFRAGHACARSSYCVAWRCMCRRVQRDEVTCNDSKNGYHVAQSLMATPLVRRMSQLQNCSVCGIR